MAYGLKACSCHPLSDVLRVSGNRGGVEFYWSMYVEHVQR